MITEVLWTGKAVMLFLILLMASYSDLKSRIVSDRFSVLILLLSIIPPKPFQVWGLFCSLPFLIAAITSGGIGGADIKIMSAAGTILGMTGGIIAMMIGLAGMLLFHGGTIIAGRLKNKKVGNACPLVPFLAVGIFTVYLSDGICIYLRTL